MQCSHLHSRPASNQWRPMLGPINPAEIKNLAPLPLSVLRLMQLVCDPGSDLAEVCSVVIYDQALTANVLRWANSSWSQAQTPIDTVSGAVVRLGIQNIFKLSIGYHLMGPFNQAAVPYNLAENELWLHSAAAALSVEHMKKLTPTPLPPAAFAAALMHDIGKLILGRHLGLMNMTEIIKEEMAEYQLSYVEAEKKVMKTDHAEVGAAIALSWHLPSALVNAIANHHSPDTLPDPITDAVHIGNAIAKIIGLGMGIEGMQLLVSNSSAERLGLTASLIQSLCANVKFELETTQEKWKMT